MLRRYSYIAKDEGLGNRGTKTFNIDIQDPITQFWLEMRCANGASYNKHNPMHECVSGIEVIDGSTVLWSLDGEQLLAKVCADLGHFPHQRFTALGGDPASLALPIQFGRYLGDKERSLDPKRFKTPQIRITWNLAANQAVGATGFATGGLTCTILADIMEGAPAPGGFISAQEAYTWSTVEGTEYIGLDTKWPIRGLMFRGHKLAYHPYGVISHVKLNANGNKFVPIDVDVEDLLYQLMLTQPRLDYRSADILAHGDTFYSYLNELEDVMMIHEHPDPADLSYWNYEYGSKTVGVHTSAGAEAGARNIGCHVHGYCPFGYIYIPFGDQRDPADWFPAPSFEKLRFEALGAVATSECALALVVDRRYV